MMSQPSESGALFSIFIVSLQTKQLSRSISGLLSSFKRGSSGTQSSPFISPSPSARLTAVDLVDRGLQKPHNVVRLSAYGGELFHRLDHDRYHFGGQI